mgnify:CR=1 FL=1
MKVYFITNPIAQGWNPNEIEKFLTANEESIALLSAALVRQGGCDVSVYTSLNCGPLEWEGVKFRPLGLAASAPDADVLVSYKTTIPWLWGTPRAHARVHWTVDAEGPWAAPVFNKLNLFVAISDFHASLMPWLKERNVHALRVSPLGFDMRPFREHAQARDPIALYTSSPDRGLETLLQDWPQISLNHPGLKKLLVTYDVNRLSTMGGPQGAAYAAHLRMLAAAAPNVQFTGPLPREQHLTLLKKAQWYIHPLNRKEADLCGYGAQKAALGGCMPVLNGLVGTGFAEFIREAVPYREFLHGGTTPRNNGLFSRPALSWDTLAREFWLPEFEQALKERT